MMAQNLPFASLKLGTCDCVLFCYLTSPQMAITDRSGQVLSHLRALGLPSTDRLDLFNPRKRLSFRQLSLSDGQV